MSGNDWSATVPAPQPQPLVGEVSADVVVIGASGCNGGFLNPSLTHGLANGLAHFPDEIDLLQQLADDNYAGMVDFFARHQVACDFEATGMLDVAVTPHQVDERAPGAPRAGVGRPPRRAAWTAAAHAGRRGHRLRLMSAS